MTLAVRISSLFLFLTFTCATFSSARVATLAVQTLVSQPQDQNDLNDERSTAKSEEFIRTRPKGSKASQAGGRYRVTSSKAPNHGRPGVGKHYQTNFTIGVTIGRARGATDAELNDSNIAKIHSKAGADFVLERISGDATVTDGTLTQMMIEYLADGETTPTSQNNRVGYLYVINRVQYADGTYSEPRLIFPTRRTYGGDNRVLPGKVVILPDPQRLWEISRNASREQAFETYLIIVSSETLRDSKGVALHADNLPERPITLDQRMVASWVKRWGGGALRAELDSASSKYLTQREQAASGNMLANERDTREQASDLTQADLPPQTVFRKSVGSTGKMLVTIKLPFKDSATTARSQH